MSTIRSLDGGELLGIAPSDRMSGFDEWVQKTYGFSNRVPWMMSRHGGDVRVAAPTSDVIVIDSAGRTPHVLCQQRNQEPCKGAWCLPGGHLDYEEVIACGGDLVHAFRTGGIRETYEETGLTLEPDSVDAVGVLTAPGRYLPGLDIVTVAFAAIAPNARRQPLQRCTESRQLGWLPLDAIAGAEPRVPLAFSQQHAVMQAAKDVGLGWTRAGVFSATTHALA